MDPLNNFKAVEVSDKITAYIEPSASLEIADLIPYLRREAPSGDIRKKKRAQRKIFYYENPKGCDLYIKKLSYKDSPRFRDQLRGFRWEQPKAIKQMAGLLGMKMAGVKTIRPVAVVIEQYSSLKNQSLFVAEALEGIKLKEYLEGDNTYEDKIDYIFKGYMDIRKMHSINLSHGDTNVGNIILDSKGDHIWLDFDRINRSTVYMEVKGRFYDLELFMQSSILSLIKSGDWNEANKKTYFRVLDAAYPGHRLMKNLAMASNKRKIEGF